MTYIKGIGLSTSKKILKEGAISPDTRVKDLTETELNTLRELVEKGRNVEGDLARQVATDIRRLKEIGSYRGLRHKAGLPSRGQRTKTNARTRKGRKVTVGSGRKKAVAKT